MKISFITPCIRPEALPFLYKSILRGTAPSDEITWYIIYDGKRVKLEDEYKFTNVAPHVTLICETHYNRWSVSGNAQRNRALDQISDGWVYFLDDDNILHPDLFAAIKQNTAIHPDVKCFLFRQICNYNKNTLREVRIRVAAIDSAQCTLHSSLIGPKDRWILGKYYADGVFIKHILSKYPAHLSMKLDGVYAYYNAMGIKELVEPLND